MSEVWKSCIYSSQMRLLGETPHMYYLAQISSWSSPPPSIVLSKYRQTSLTCLAAAPQHSAHISRNSTFRLQTVFVVQTNVGWPKKAWNQMEQIIGVSASSLQIWSGLRMREAAGCCYGPGVNVNNHQALYQQQHCRVLAGPGCFREGLQLSNDRGSLDWWERDVVLNHWGTWWVCLSRVLNRVFTPK